MGECFDCLGLDDGDGRVKCLCVTIRGSANKADILVGVCCSPPNKDEEADEMFCKLGLSSYHISSGNSMRQEATVQGASGVYGS